jgi:hypothetical protein
VVPLSELGISETRYCPSIRQIWTYGFDLPLNSLTNLTDLQLYRNTIRDVGPLASLTNLNVLNLNSNDVIDVTPLKNLTSLRELGLSHNRIGDVADLSSLTNLELPTLNNNQISKGVAELQTLTRAIEIRLVMNTEIPCRDLRILVAATGKEVVTEPDTCTGS